MGTRSLTYVKSEYDTDDNIICMYRQYDGYPEGHGLDLANFLNGFRVINGFNGNPKLRANGMGCLSAQIIKHLKEGIGNIYLYPPNSKDCGEEYIYEIFMSPILGQQNIDNVLIKCIDVWNGNQVIFEGSPQEFIYQYGEKLQEDEVQISN
jgi:hypothetical protein